MTSIHGTLYFLWYIACVDLTQFLTQRTEKPISVFEIKSEPISDECEATATKIPKSPSDDEVKICAPAFRSQNRF